MNCQLRKIATATTVGLGLIGFIPGPVTATLLPENARSSDGDCAAAARSLAEAYGLSAQVPKAELRGNRLLIPNPSDTSGVIKPPKMDSEAVIPPPTVPETMPVAPEIGPDSSAASRAPSAGQRLRAEAMLFAAVAADERGDEKSCKENLEKAHEILHNPGR